MKRAYWIWVAALSAVVAAAAACYLRQLEYGLGLTGMSRDVSWGLYIGQFTFAVGIAASAVMLVLPYYLHDAKAFARIVLFGEFVAIGSVTACLLFVFADMGQPARVLNVIRYASPASIMFWDMVSLGGYLVLNIVMAVVALRSERQETMPPRWIRPIILASIPWAISIHTVTAFLYCGLAGRPFWYTAILAPRFLSSAFASGPALLILVLLALRRLARLNVEPEALGKLATIATYAAFLNVFFILVEAFTTKYGGVAGQSGDFAWVPTVLAVAGLALLVTHRTVLGCVMTFVSLWIDKGLEMVVSGFVPSPTGAVTAYTPTAPEMTIAGGVWAAGALVATLLFRTAIASRRYVDDSD
jgi:[DsrC]-trisulfide reductase subunit P